MPFSYARFVSFRNLEDSEVDTRAERIFLIGENGQGKTNFLEALYYLCYGASFRGLVDQQIPAAGSRGFGLAAAWSSLAGGGALEDSISIRYDGQTKDIRLNGKGLRDRKELVFHNPAVVFCHEDFSFAAGDPERRRFFFDQCAGSSIPAISIRCVPTSAYSTAHAASRKAPRFAGCAGSPIRALWMA